MNKLEKSIVYRGFKNVLENSFNKDIAIQIWTEANEYLDELEHTYPDITGDSKMMVLPAAALYKALYKQAPEQTLELLKNYGTQTGNKIAKIIHGFTSIPGVSKLLWNNMPMLMRKMSSPELGYTREIVSETDELVAVDILSCPLHDASMKIDVPEAAQVVCAMDKAYMTGFKYIDYTRTTSVAEGDRCCDYKLKYNGNKNCNPPHLEL